VRLHQWDAETPEGWVELIDADTVIVNLAGENIAGATFLPQRWTDRRKERLERSRINTGRAVAAAVAAAAEKPRAVLQSSAVGYYGSDKSSDVKDESAAPGDDFLARLCVRWEASSAGVTEHGVRHVVLRTGVVLSTDDGSLPRLLLPYRLFVGGPYGSGRQYWSWIHLEDTVRAIHFLAESEDASGPYNLTAPNPVPNREFGKALGSAMGRPSLIPVPGFALRLVVGEVATVVLDGQRAIPAALDKAGFDFSFPEVEPALRDLLERGI
jgi:uncharacterized protein (TIGR01777 family)